MLEKIPNPIFDNLKGPLIGEFSQSEPFTDEDGSEDENTVSWYEYAHSSSAHAFLQVALGTFMYDKTPMKSVKPVDAASPEGIIDAARLFT